MTTKLQIINNALLMVGAETISTLTDSSREARVASSVYDVTREDLLARNPWDFALGQVQLAQVATTPLFGFDHAYQLPVNPKALRIMRKNDPPNDYRIFEDKLYTDDNEVAIIFLFDPGEQNYPAYFIRLIEYELAKIFAFALMQDETQGQIFENLMARQMRVARSINAQNSPSTQIDSTEYSLTSVR